MAHIEVSVVNSEIVVSAGENTALMASLLSDAEQAVTEAEQAVTDATAQAAIAAGHAADAGDSVALAAHIDARQRYLNDLEREDSQKPAAAVIILLGQSLNASFSISGVGSDVQAQRYANALAVMPVGGIGISEFDYAASNFEHTPNAGEFTSYVALDEGVKQSPAAGIANALAGSKFAKLYITSAAIGARDFGKLQGAGPRASLYAVVHRACGQARADGFRPVVMGCLAEGEADAAFGTTEANFYTLGANYIRMFQLLAAQAMGKPEYVAPVAISYPLQSNNAYGGGANDRAIKEALRRLARDLPGAIDIGPIYQWPNSGDLVHPLPMGYVQRGEAYGRALRNWYEYGQTGGESLQMIDVTLSGSTFVATFNKPIVRDASTAWATALAGTEGFEWSDNGTARTISALVYSGCCVTGTVTGVTGTLSQQVLRYGSQVNTPGGFLEEIPGGYVRGAGDGWASWVDPAYVNYQWAIPQVFDEVRAV